MKVASVKELLPSAEVYEISEGKRIIVLCDRTKVSENSLKEMQALLEQADISCVVLGVFPPLADVIRIMEANTVEEMTGAGTDSSSGPN